MKCSLVLMAFLVGVCYGTTQTVSVKGRLMCNGRPYAGAKLKLYDSDTFSLDDKMAQANSDSQGNFQLTGSTSNLIFNADPKFNIYHRCGMTVPICSYKSSYKIPSQYINTGSYPSQVYDAQTIELTMLPQSRDCINK